jgi:hypothetical protein
MLQAINLDEEFSKTPKKQDIYNWISTSWQIITPKEIVKAFLTSGISISMTGEEDSLSENVLRLKKNVSQEEVFMKEEDSKKDPFMEDQFIGKEDQKAFCERCYNGQQDEHFQELTIDS